MKTTDESRHRYHTGDRINQQFLVLQDALVGGMGEVYKCKEENAGGTVAVKMLRHDRTRSPLIYNLLKQEAATWLELGKQRNIVLFHSVLVSDSNLAVVSEWIEPDMQGRSRLVDWLGNGPLPLQMSLDLAMDIARGLLHAQTKVPGIVHRDLKPSNILIGWTKFYRGVLSGSAPVQVREQVAKIGDRGLATVADEAERHEIWPRRTNMVGTWRYMAPEQWNGWHSDLRTDIYGLGCMFFEMLTGRCPYQQSTQEQLKRSHTQTEIPRLPTTVPQSQYFQRVVDGCLAKNPSDRYDDLHEFIYDLARVYENSFGSTPRGIESDVVSFDETYFHNRGLAYVTFGQYEKALDCFEQALRADPSFSYSHFGRAIVFLHRGKYKDAIGELDKAIQLTPSVARFYTNRAVAHKHLGETADAIRDFNKALELDPNDSIVFTNRGNLFLATGDFENALQDYAQAIALSPSEGQNYHNCARVYSCQGRHQEAIQDLTQAISRDPTNCEHYLRRANILFEIGKYHESVIDCTKAIDCEPSSSEAFRRRAYAYDKLHLHEKAEQDRKMASQLRAPGAGSANDGRCAAPFEELMRQGQLLSKEAEFESLVALMTRAISIRPTAAEPYYERGIAFAALGAYMEALTDFSRVLELEPVWKHVRYARAEVQLKLGRFQAAIEDLNIGIAQLPDDGDYYFMRAKCREELGRLDQAIADYGAAIKCDPNNPRPYNNRAVIRQEMGQDDLALADFLNAYRCDPGDPDYCVGVGSVYYERGQLAEAAPYFEEAYRLGDEEAAAVAMQLRRRLGYTPPQVDPAHSAIELFLEANLPEAMRRAVLRCPFMSTNIFLESVAHMASNESRIKHDAIRRRKWLHDVLNIREPGA